MPPCPFLCTTRSAICLRQLVCRITKSQSLDSITADKPVCSPVSGSDKEGTGRGNWPPSSQETIPDPESSQDAPDKFQTQGMWLSSLAQDIFAHDLRTSTTWMSPGALASNSSIVMCEIPRLSLLRGWDHCEYLSMYDELQVWQIFCYCLSEQESGETQITHFVVPFFSVRLPPAGNNTS